MGRFVVPSILASVLLLAGCGGGGYGQSTSTTPTSTSSTVGAAAGTPTPSADVATSTATPGLAGEDLTADQAAQLQQDVDAGHQPWRLDEVAVAQAFVAGRLGWTDVDARLTDPQTVEVSNRPDSATVTLQLQQPVREGPDGIWVVASGAQPG
jgi:hypothetical protein